jgi:hypothetical protein
MGTTIDTTGSPTTSPGPAAAGAQGATIRMRSKSPGREGLAIAQCRFRLRLQFRHLEQGRRRDAHPRGRDPGGSGRQHLGFTRVAQAEPSPAERRDFQPGWPIVALP